MSEREAVWMMAVNLYLYPALAAALGAHVTHESKRVLAREVA